MTGATPLAAADHPETLSSFHDEVAWIAAKLFQLIAAWRREPHWKLATHEANDLAASFVRMVTKTFPKETAKALESFFGKWGPVIGFILVMQMIIEPRVNTSNLAKQPRPLRAMPGGRAPDLSMRPSSSSPEPVSPALDPSPDAVAVPDVRPGSFKDALDGSPVPAAEVPL